MVYRVLGGLIFSLVGWMFMIWSGALGGSAFDVNFFGDGKLIERPVAEVYAALDAIDMNRDSELAVLEKVPEVSKVATPNQSISWTVFAGKHPAMTLATTLEPAKEGAATVLRTDVTRHDLPDGQVVASAFQQPGAFELVLKFAMAEALAPLDSDYAREVNKANVQAMSPAAMIRTAETQFTPAYGQSLTRQGRMGQGKPAPSRRGAQRRRQSRRRGQFHPRPADGRSDSTLGQYARA
jgi:hypothetical protein